MIAVLENINKSFGAHQVLEDISAQIDDDHKIGLIGANGAGKSTLLNILYRDLEQDSGRVIYGSGKTMGFLRQNNGLDDNNTIASEMRRVFKNLDDIWDEMKALEQKMSTMEHDTDEYSEIALRYASLQNQYEIGEGYQINAKISTVLNGMGFGDTPRDKSIGVLSGGEKTRLAISKLLLEEPDLLILDEPTNHLDFPTLMWLEDYLSTYRGALLIVSHDRYFLDRVCSTIWEVENKTLDIYSGNYSKYLLLKEDKQSLQLKEYESQQEEIHKMEDFIARNIVRASTTKRAQSRQKALERMEIVDAPAPPPKPPSLEFTIKREPVSDVLIVEDMALSVGTEQKVELFSELDIHVEKGEKIAVVGHNGIGKSSFLKAILSKIPHDNGRIQWGRNTDISYFEQGEGELDLRKSAIDELWDEFPRESEYTIRTTLARAGLRGEEVFKKVGSLSGGEKARLKFAKLMLEHGNVIIMDEPTNHLDLPTKEVLDKSLENYGGTLIVVSHDRYLLNKFPDRIVEMHDKGIDSYTGKYDDYVRQKEIKKQKLENAALSEQKSDDKTENAGKGSYRTREQRREAAERRQRFSELEKLISTLESEIEVLEADIQKPEIAEDYLALEEKCSSMEQKKIELNTYMNEWLELGLED